VTFHHRKVAPLSCLKWKLDDEDRGGGGGGWGGWGGTERTRSVLGMMPLK
jgi:hypothetical protein